MKCVSCGKLSHVISSTANGIPATTFILCMLGLLASLILQSLPVVLAGAGVASLYNVWAWRRVELFPISEEASKSAGNETLIAVVVTGLLKMFSS